MPFARVWVAMPRKVGAAAGIAHAIFVRVYRFFGGHAPNFVVMPIKIREFGEL